MTYSKQVTGQRNGTRVDLALVPIAKWYVWRAFGPAGWREGVELRQLMDAEDERIASARAQGLNPYPDAITADELIEEFDIRHYWPRTDGRYRIGGPVAFGDLPRRREPVA